MARALLIHGITDRFEMWDAERPYPRMAGDIETCAGLMVSDEGRDGLRVKRWKHPEARQDDSQSAMSDSADDPSHRRKRALVARYPGLPRTAVFLRVIAAGRKGELYGHHPSDLPWRG